MAAQDGEGLADDITCALCRLPADDVDGDGKELQLLGSSQLMQLLPTALMCTAVVFRVLQSSPTTRAVKLPCCRALPS